MIVKPTASAAWTSTSRTPVMVRTPPPRSASALAETWEVPSVPVAVMVASADAELVTRLKELDVRRLLLQPFRLRDVVHTLEQLWPMPQALAA